MYGKITNFGDHPFSFIVSCAFSIFWMCIKLREGVEWFSYVCLFVFLYFVSLTRLHLTLMLQKSPLDGKKLAKKGGYPALPQGTCKEHSNIFAARCRKVSAIHVIETKMHERLVLISGQAITGPLSPLALGTRTPTISHCC